MPSRASASITGWVRKRLLRLRDKTAPLMRPSHPALSSPSATSLRSGGYSARLRHGALALLGNIDCLSRMLHPPSAPQCFVAGIPSSRLATCLTAHPTNRVVACRSVRHSPPRPLPHLPIGAFSFAASALADVPSARLTLPRHIRTLHSATTLATAFGSDLRSVDMLRGSSLRSSGDMRFRPHHNLISPRLIF